MAIFGRKIEEHAGSGIDKPDPKGVIPSLLDKIKGVGGTAAGAGSVKNTQKPR